MTYAEYQKDIHMTTHPSAQAAMLSRVESALSRATGLNRSIKTLLTGGIYPYDWLGDVEDVQDVLMRAVLDISQLKSDLLALPRVAGR